MKILYRLTALALLVPAFLQTAPAFADRATSYTYYPTTGLINTINGPRVDVSDITTLAYDAQGNISTITNAPGHVTQITTHDSNGRPTTIIDPSGLTSTLTYWPRGWLKTRKVGTLTTSFTYDNAGQLTKVTLPDASYLAYTYDDAGRLTDITNILNEKIHYTLDNAGNRTKEDVLDSSGVIVQSHSRQYDELNRVIAELNAVMSLTTEYSYDANGNRTDEVRYNSNGSASTTYSYDDLNRLNEVTDALNGISDFAYDAQDQLTGVTDPKQLLTSYDVDGLGDLHQTTSPDTGIATQTFDEAGNLKTSLNANGKTTSYSYDALNRVTLIQYQDGSSATFSYDSTASGNYGKGRLTGVSDSTGSLAYVYDQYGRLKTKTQVVGGITRTQTYTYDSYGRVLTYTTPGAKVITYGYNTAGQISSVKVGSTTYLSNIVYRSFGAAKSWTWSDSTSYTRTFDADGRLKTYPLGSSNVTLGYDLQDRVTSLSGALSQSFGYDNLDRVSDYTSGAAYQHFSYDANGNRLQRTANTGTSNYNISATSNRLTSVSGIGQRTYTHDYVGNVATYSAMTFTYNAANRLSQMSKTAETDTYTYNGFGQRVKKVTGTAAVVRLFAYNEGGYLIGEYKDTGVMVSEVVYLGGQPVVLLQGSSVYFIHADQLNAPRLLTSTTQAVLWRWDSAPFGETVPNEDVDGNGTKVTFNWRFPGQYYDSETGLLYNYFRDYDPTTGRYIESDPIGLAGGINTYTYVGGNPLRYSDPTGEIAIADDAVLLAGFAALAAGAACQASNCGQAILNGLSGAWGALSDWWDDDYHNDENWVLDKPVPASCSEIKADLEVMKEALGRRLRELRPEHANTPIGSDHRVRIQRIKDKIRALEKAAQDCDNECK